MPDGIRRFGVLVHQDPPFPTLGQRWRHIEELGFDQIFVPDHVGDYRDLGGTWFDGWTVLAAMALETRRVAGRRLEHPRPLRGDGERDRRPHPAPERQA
jgi:hypothetical protein